MMRKIRLYGELAKFVGHREFTAVASNAAEAVRFLLANFPGLDQHMMGYDYRVLIGSYNINQKELNHPVGQNTIRIIPVVAGARGSVGKIIAGIAIVAAAIFIPGLGIGLAGATVTQIGLVGASLALSGVSQLLAPVPKIAPPSQPSYYTPTSTKETQLDPQKSYSFSGIQNTSKVGSAVPIVYGETIVGSVVISANFNTLEVT
jgi:predicted phage tail protein